MAVWYGALIVCVTQLWLSLHISKVAVSPLCSWTAASLEHIATAPS